MVKWWIEDNRIIIEGKDKEETERFFNWIFDQLFKLVE